MVDRGTRRGEGISRQLRLRRLRMEVEVMEEEVMAAAEERMGAGTVEGAMEPRGLMRLLVILMVCLSLAIHVTRATCGHCTGGHVSVESLSTYRMRSITDKTGYPAPPPRNPYAAPPPAANPFQAPPPQQRGRGGPPQNGAYGGYGGQPPAPGYGGSGYGGGGGGGGYGGGGYGGGGYGGRR